MPDLADIAQEIILVDTDNGVNAARRDLAQMPAGEPGECEVCLDDSPRLVGGKCAPCRDGRK